MSKNSDQTRIPTVFTANQAEHFLPDYIEIDPQGSLVQKLSQLGEYCLATNIDSLRTLAILCCAHFDEARKSVHIFSPKSSDLPGFERDVEDAFRPDAILYRQIMAETGLLSGLENYARLEAFKWVVNEFTAQNLHLMSYDQVFGSLMDRFTHELFTVDDELAQLAQETRDNYLQLRNQNLLLKDTLSELLWNQECSRVEQEHIRADFMKLFGKEYIAMQRTFQETKQLELKLEILRQSPDCSEAEADRQVNDLFQAEKDRLSNLELMPAMPFKPTCMVASYIDERELARQTEEAKRLLRKITALIHPDSWQYREKEALLSEQQKAIIDELRQFIMDVKFNELGHMPGMIGRGRRSVEHLQLILGTILSLFENAGISTDTDMVLVGSIEAQITQLEGYNSYLTHQVEIAKQELVELLEDETIAEFRAILAAPHRHSNVRKGLTDKQAEYQKRVDALTAELQKLTEKKHG